MRAQAASDAAIAKIANTFFIILPSLVPGPVAFAVLLGIVQAVVRLAVGCPRRADFGGEDRPLRLHRHGLRRRGFIHCTFHRFRVFWKNRAKLAIPAGKGNSFPTPYSEWQGPEPSHTIKVPSRTVFRVES